MGGQLLHHWNLPEKRLSLADFQAIAVEVLDKLDEKYCARRRRSLLEFFSEKESFGDMDVALEVFSGDNANLVADMEELFGYKPHKNGNCISFPVNGFQVDVLLFSSECWHSALTYYAYESGNFMGRIADKLGFKYGHRGLYLHVPLNYFDADLPDHEYRDILISRQPYVIFSILGFDYDRMLEGFKNFDEMAEWVANSKYFAPQFFAFEELNSINRTRNRKRPVYAKFVEWCAQQPANENLPNVQELRDRIIDLYNLEEAIEDIRYEVKLNKERRAKFNGNLVRDLRGLEKEALGKFIVDFKRSHDNFEAWLDARSADEVKQAILEF